MGGKLFGRRVGANQELSTSWENVRARGSFFFYGAKRCYFTIFCRVKLCQEWPHLAHPVTPPTGLRAFYRGMSFPLGAQLVFKAVIFTTNGVARRALEKRGLADSRVGVYACGALGGKSGLNNEDVNSTTRCCRARHRLPIFARK